MVSAVGTFLANLKDIVRSTEAGIVKRQVTPTQIDAIHGCPNIQSMMVVKYDGNGF
jgi:hypothetical protein